MDAGGRTLRWRGAVLPCANHDGALRQAPAHPGPAPLNLSVLVQLIRIYRGTSTQHHF